MTTPAAKTTTRRKSAAAAPAAAEQLTTDDAGTPAAAAATPGGARAHLDFNAVTVTAVKPSEAKNPFARGHRNIPEDHPIVKAFNLSWDQKDDKGRGKQLELQVPAPEQAELLVKLLRKVATQKGLGVRSAIQEDGVTIVFYAKTKRAVAAKSE